MSWRIAPTIVKRRLRFSLLVKVKELPISSSTTVVLEVDAFNVNALKRMKKLDISIYTDAIRKEMFNELESLEVFNIKRSKEDLLDDIWCDRS